MATEKLEIVVGADVQDVVQKLDQIEKVAKTTMQKTATSFEPVTKAIEKVEVKAFDVDKAFREAMGRISATVDKNVDNAIRSFDALEKNIQQDAASSVRAVKTLEDKFKAFGGISGNAAAKSLDQLTGKLKELPKGANQASFALTNLGRVAQDAPFGFIGIQNNINPLLESFGRLKQETGSTGAAIKALAAGFLGPAGLGVAISLVTSAITFFIQAKQRAKSETKALKEEEDVFVNTLAKEKVQLDNLFAIATSANVPLKARTEAIKELRQNYGAYLKDFSDEEILAGKAASAYQRLATALINVARAKAAEAQQIENSKKILDNEGKIAKIREQAQKDAANAKGDIGVVAGEAFIREGTKERQIDNVFKRAREEAEKLRKENVALGEEQKRLADAILKNQVEPFKEVKTTTEGIVNNVRTLNVELEKTYSDLSKVVKQSAEIKNNLDPTIINKPRQTNPINVGKADRTSSVVITEEALQKQGEYLLKMDEIIAKMKQFQEIGQVAIGGINAGIDQFFNALANNQDPFEALQQSVKRLVVELAAAVVKMLLLKAISAALTGGASAGLEGLAGAGGGGGVLDFFLRGDLLTGAVTRSAGRRRGG